MNFSGISARTLLGKILRLPLRLVPRRMAMPIPQGRLRGRRWIVGSGNHGCWLGSYESEKQKLLAQTIRPGDIVFDIGAHAGFYTLLAAELVGERGMVCAFEPAPDNLGYLERHVEMNRYQNVRIFPVAVCDRCGMSHFEMGKDSHTGHLSLSHTGLQVHAVSLDEQMAAGELPVPNVIKIDVEGTEFQVLLGAKSLLKTHHPTLFLATHGQDIHLKCRELLSELGYRLHPIIGNDVNNTDEILATEI